EVEGRERSVTIVAVAACRPRTASPRTTNSAIIAQRPDSKTSKLWAVSINYPLTYCAVGNSSASHSKETEGDTCSSSDRCLPCWHVASSWRPRVEATE